MLNISLKKTTIILLIISIILLSINAVTAFEENNTQNNSQDNVLTSQSEIYVCNNNNSNIIDGSFNSPFNNLNEAISYADNDSTILLFEGTYTGDLNTGLIIDKNLIIKSYNSGVVIDGENKNTFFKIQNSSSLTIKDIEFTNGYCDSQNMAVFENNGDLTLNNISIKNMNSFMGVIFNKGNLNINNTLFTDSTSSLLGQAIVNLEKCSLVNTNISNNPSGKIDVSVYNYKNMMLNCSNIDYISSNLTYDEENIHELNLIIENSKINTLQTNTTLAEINNTYFTGNIRFYNSRTIIKNSNLTYKSEYLSTITSINSNLTITSSVINNGISCPQSRINITYSIILGTISGGGSSNTEVYAPYNWWGSNKGPQIQYAKTDTGNWIIMLFESDENPINVGTQEKFTVSLNKILSNNDILDLVDPQLLPQRKAYFESENGFFAKANGYLENGTLENYLINNTEDSLVYAIIDSQRLRLLIGEGSTNYTLYVSALRGSNAIGDGSYENPYLTLAYAVNRAINGNTIYMLDGNYSYGQNNDLTISKNLFIKGIGNVNLIRDDNRVIFKITNIGNLTIENINFTVLSNTYSNPLFSINGGNLTVINSSFTDISSYSIINPSSYSKITISQCYFKDNMGSICSDSSNILVNNTVFENNKKYYTNSYYYDYNYFFPSSGPVEVQNSIFIRNELGIVNLRPTLQSAYLTASYPYSSYAYFKNTSFIENEFKDLKYPYYSFKMYNDYGSFYGFIDNCSFIDNKGLKINLNNLNNSFFLNNQLVINAVSVNNSYFENNTNLAREGSSYVGDGVVNANTVINSTFISNKAAYGGALYNPKEVHYSVFINNTAQYEGNDIFSYSGDVNYSGNWWGDNQKPDSAKIYIFLGNLIIDDWIIMTLESTSKNTFEAALKTLLNTNQSTSPLNYNINSRKVYFTTDSGQITPQTSQLINNTADAILSYDELTHDFKVYAKIDNQLLDFTVRNNSTEIIMENTTFHGKYNKYNVTLININGYSIANQTLKVDIINSTDTLSFNIQTDDNGHAEIPFQYPSGEYLINISYEGNGYYEKSDNTAIINVLSSETTLVSLNYTFHGKNNNYYSILLDDNERGVLNQTVIFTIINSQNQSRTIKSVTDIYGRADVILDLDVGNYTIIADFNGDGWYMPSKSISNITVLPVNSTITLLNTTLYGLGNIYNITLKDAYGTPVVNENIEVIISKNNLSDTFILQSDNEGIAHLSINYLPGTYTVKATYHGDLIYGSAEAEGIINVEKVRTTLSGFSHTTIPLNGYYSVVLTDKYGRRIISETITLNVYRGKLIKTYSAISDGNGEAVFKIDLNEDTYLATYNYNGSTWYCQSTGAATIVVNNNTILSNIEMNASDLIQYYGENKYFVISFNDPNSFSQFGKNILITITSDTFSQNYNLVTDAFGQVRLQINLNPGVYNITYTYKNDFYNIYSEKSNNIFIYRMPSSIIANDVIVKENDVKYIEIYLRDINNNPLKNMQVNLNINNAVYNVTTNDEGIARHLISLNKGTYIAEFSFSNPNYLTSSGACEILVTDSDKITTFIKAYDVNANDSQLISYNVSLKDELNNGVSSSNIIISVYDTNGNSIMNSSSATDNDGVAIFNLNLTYGNYILKAYYPGSDRYLQSNSLNYINVESTGNLTKTFITGILDKNNTYKITLIDENGNKIKFSEIMFNVNNKTYFTTTDENGEASIYLGLVAGVYNIKTLFEGEGYEKTMISQEIYLSGVLTYLFGPDIVKYYNNGTNFNVQLLDSVGKALSGKEIIFTVNNVNYTNKTNELGWASLVIDLKPGNYSVISNYIASDPLENAITASNITVLSTIIADNLIKYYRNNSQFSAGFLDSNGHPVKNTNVSILFEGISYIRVTDENGFITLAVNSEVGKYNITVQNPNDGLIQTYNITVLPYSTLKQTIFEGKLLNNTYQILLKDADNNPVSNVEIKVIIENNTYSAVSDDSGIVNVELPYEFGVYHLEAIFNGNSAFAKSSFSDYFVVSGNLNYLFAENMVKFYRNNTQFRARLVDVENNALEGKVVQLMINGRNYSRLTDNEGWINFNVNLRPGEYDVICSYYSDNPLENAFCSSKITVLSTIIAFDLVKYYKNASQFYVKMIDGNGNGVVNQDVSMNINGVLYTRKTNDLGIAKLNINLSPGSYIITVNNSRDGLLDSFTVTVLSTIHSNDLVKFYRNNSQFYVKLLDGNGNPLRNAGVSMNINGVFYTRNTDDSGVAKLNINLGAGEYVLTSTHPSGLMSSNKITVLSILEGGDLILDSGEGGVFRVVLYDGVGHVLSGQMILFNINGVLYNRVTDVNGVASLNIRLPYGRYLISSSFEDFVISNTILIK